MRSHSTLSRREFMKGLSIVGVGIGSAALASPTFHDLDELASSSEGVSEKRPWWQKERKYLDMTTEVDWDVKQRWHGKYNNWNAHITAEHVNDRMQQTLALRKQECLDKKPGYDLRTRILGRMGWLPMLIVKKAIGSLGEGLEAFDTSPTILTPIAASPLRYDQCGVPRWEGTPEENARMMRSMIRWAGGSTVGFGKIDEKSIKLIDALSGGKQVVFEDVDKSYQTSTKFAISNKSKNVITTIVRQPLSGTRFNPSFIGMSQSTRGYGEGEVVAVRIMEFLRLMGYQSALAPVAPNVAWGATTGLGELSRANPLLTPEVGLAHRYTRIFLTDLPLPVTNPIDAGMNRFCFTCKKCAVACPPAALPLETEPSWDITQGNSTQGNPDQLQPELFNNKGHKAWFFNHFACASYWAEVDSYCGTCVGVCVFSKLADSSVHAAVKAAVGSTSVLNSFFIRMDNAFGYNNFTEKVYSEWWDKPDKYQPLRDSEVNY